VNPTTSLSVAAEGRRSFKAYAWTVLCYTVVVIAWGAYVRATGSGAGCGEHWPLCNGEVIPRDPSMARLIEFSHRLSSGLSLVLVAALVVWSRRIFAKGHAVRRAGVWSLGFILGEALVGAMLVILQLVAGNDSVLRAVVIALHLVNTFLLLFWLSRVVYEAGHEQNFVTVTSVKRARFNVMLCLLAFGVTGAAGAIVALGDTLFPVKTLAEGVAQDFSEAAHFLIKLRIWHPMIAVVTTGYVLLQTVMLPRVFPGIVPKKLGFTVGGVIVLQMLGGFLNWWLLAPVPMQLLHLICADVTWILMCFWYFNIGRVSGVAHGG
jgi:cytochrome c oxidase assembly protein subunit 15